MIRLSTRDVHQVLELREKEYSNGRIKYRIVHGVKHFHKFPARHSVKRFKDLRRYHHRSTDPIMDMIMGMGKSS